MQLIIHATSSTHFQLGFVTSNYLSHGVSEVAIVVTIE